MLEAEYDRIRLEKLAAALKQQRPVNDTPKRTLNGSPAHNPTPSNFHSYPMRPVQVPSPVRQDALVEANALRQHKGRLEARMEILEDHNRQLELQLLRLKQLLESDSASRNGHTSRNGSRNGQNGQTNPMFP